LYNGKNAATLPFYEVLKIRQGYRCRPNALTPQQIDIFFKTIDDATILGIRDYALYALLYQLGLRVGEGHYLDLQSLDFENAQITAMGKVRKPRTLHLKSTKPKISVIENPSHC
jgi:site-specific recombinase XerC